VPTPRRQRVPLRRDPIETAHENWIDAGWTSSADGMALVTSIMRIHQILLARADALLRPYDLTFARFEVLMLLRFSRRGRLPVGKIGERLQVHPASVTNAIQRLTTAGLVERHTNPADRRSTLASITPQGRALVQTAAEALNANLFSDIGLETDDQRVTFRALQRWRHTHGDFSAT
jgi:DNA-binding MarR family transcriptional regulator